MAKVTRVSGMVSVALLLMGTVPQCHDLVRFMYEDGLSFSVLPLFVSSTLLSIAIWYSARVLLYQTLPALQYHANVPAVRIWTTWYPRILGSSAWLCIITTAFPNAADRAEPHLYKALIGLIIFSLGGMAAVVVFQCGRFRLAKLAGFKASRAASLERLASDEAIETRGIISLKHPELRQARLIIISANSLAFVLGLVITFTHGRIAVPLGAFPTVFLSLAFITMLASGSVYYSAVSGLPIASGIAAMAILFSALSLNDNHAVRKTAEAAPSGPEISSAFTNWLTHRQDLSRYHNGYPVLLVSAEGGGIRAAYHTAMVLGALQDANPAFAQHVFCISGVSGGSVGATLFAKLCAVRATNAPDLHPTDQQAFRACLDQILRDDWIAPAIAMLLFSDLAQRFIPYPFSFLDRAPALESAMERSWTHALVRHWQYHGAGLDKAFHTLADGFESNAVPALFLNTTHVETGERIVISSFQCRPAKIGFLLLHSVNSNLDIPISTAAFLSARFPIVSPAALLETDNTNPVPVHLVDGGVFENSGCSTLADIYRVLYDDSNSTNWPSSIQKPRFILFRIDTVDPTPALRANPPPRFEPSMIIPPVTAFLNSRDAHASVAAFNIDEFLDKSDRRPYRLDHAKIALAINKAPLGWTLSESSRDQINGAYKLNRPNEPRQPLTSSNLTQILQDLDVK